MKNNLPTVKMGGLGQRPEMPGLGLTQLVTKTRNLASYFPIEYFVMSSP